MKKVGAASTVPLWEQTEGESVDEYDNLRDIADAAREEATELPMAEETGKRLKAKNQKITAYLSNKNINARAAARREAVTTRSKRVADASNQAKGKGDNVMIKSVFKTAQLNRNIGWARRADGTLADTPDALGEDLVAKDKFEQWFKSVMRVEGRWGEQNAWEEMLAIVTRGIDDTKCKISKGCQMPCKDLVEECYVSQGMQSRQRMKDGGTTCC